MIQAHALPPALPSAWPRHPAAMDTHELQEGPILGYIALVVALAMMLAA